MKKLYIILLLLVAGAANAQQESYFKYSPEGIIWQKVYQDSLTFDSQTINIIMKNKKKYKKSGWIGLQWQFMDKADVVVEHKDNKTRVTIKNITLKAHSLYGGDSHYDLEDFVLKNNNGKPRPWWRDRDQFRLQKYFEEKIKTLTSVEDENDW